MFFTASEAVVFLTDVEFFVVEVVFLGVVSLPVLDDVLFLLAVVVFVEE